MKRIQLKESELTRLIQRVINEKYTPSYCCVPDCSLCSVHCSGAPCAWSDPISADTASDRSDFTAKMDEPHIGESDLRRIIKRVINEDVSCKCMQLIIVRYQNEDGNVYKETHEWVFVDCPCDSQGALSPKIVTIDSDGTFEEDDDFEDGGTELANCRCPGNVLPGEYCDLNEICRAEAGGCFCREQDRGQY